MLQLFSSTVSTASTRCCNYCTLPHQELQWVQCASPTPISRAKRHCVFQQRLGTSPWQSLQNFHRTKQVIERAMYIILPRHIRKYRHISLITDLRHLHLPSIRLCITAFPFTSWTRVKVSTSIHRHVSPLLSSEQPTPMIDLTSRIRAFIETTSTYCPCFRDIRATCSQIDYHSSLHTIHNHTGGHETPAHLLKLRDQYSDNSESISAS